MQAGGESEDTSLACSSTKLGKTPSNTGRKRNGTEILIRHTQSIRTTPAGSTTLATPGRAGTHEEAIGAF